MRLTKRLINSHSRYTPIFFRTQSREVAKFISVSRRLCVLLSPPIIALQSPIPEWDLQRIWYGLAAELQGSEELRVKSEKFELVPLAMGRAPIGILHF